MHPKHHTDKQNSSQLRYVTLASLLFTYFQINTIDGGSFVYCLTKQLYFIFYLLFFVVKVENCNLIVRCIDYFQCSSPVFAMQALGDVCPKCITHVMHIIHENSLFSPSTDWKVGLRIIHESVLYARFYGDVNCELRYHSALAPLFISSTKVIYTFSSKYYTVWLAAKEFPSQRMWNVSVVTTTALLLLLLVCVSLTIIGQPRNSVLIRRV